MDHSFEYSHEYDDSFAIVSTSNIGTASGSGAQSTDPNACNQSIIVDNSEKTCKDFRVHEWIHLVISLLNNCAYLTLAGYLMYKYMSDSDHYVISTVIIVKFVFSNYFLFHGVFREQPFQIIMQIMTVFSMWTVDLIYTLFSLVHPPDRLADDRMDPEMILFYVRTAVTFINLLTGVAVTWKYFRLEQAIFKTVGTDMNRVSIFRSLFFGFSLMVFDMEISLSSLLLFLRNGFSNILVHEVAILSAGSVFIILWIYLGYTAVRTESHALTYTFYLVSVLQPVYILCLFIRNLKWSGSSEPALVVSSHVISVIALVAHFGVIAAIVTVHHFYGRGFGNALVDGVHVSVKNSAEYEELRRILFHPINPVQSYYHPHSTSRSILVNAEVY